MFIQVKSDARKSPIRSTSHMNNEIEIRYGSLTESKLLYRIIVNWDNNDDKPMVLMQSDGEIEIRHNQLIAESDNYRGVHEW